MVTESPYNDCGGDLSLDFVNSTGRGPAGPENERLVDYTAFLRWSAEAGTLSEPLARGLSRHAAQHPRDADDALERALALREALFAVLFADVQGSPPPAEELEVLNTELGRALTHARLEATEEGWGWGWPADPTDLDAPLWPIARAAADLLTSADRRRVKACDSDDCLWLFLDRTRNHGRRWCEMSGCGNRAKARRHRRRCRAGSDGDAPVDAS